MTNDSLNGSRVASMTLTPALALWQGYMIFIGMSVFAFMIARTAVSARKRIFQDQENVDMDFDAGGTASAGIIATTVVSHWTWAATLLQSSSVTTKYGISGAFWYSSGATIQLFLFAMLIIQFKIRAPGAKTFLQVIKARFGRRAHITFCVFGLVTNIIVTAMLMLGGAAVLTSLVRGLSVELATCLVAATISTYIFMGGLIAAFYVSYFNTAIMMILMMVFVVKVYFDDQPDNQLGSIDKVYSLINGTIGPNNNRDQSYLTIISFDGLMFGIINLIGNFGTVFVDQSFWQCGVAGRPRNGVGGFLVGGLTWFAVPFTFASTMGLAYLALSADIGHPLLDSDAVEKGMVAPVVAQCMMGFSGQALMVLMIVMTITSTGSAEIIAVTSILVYDIYQIYLKPFRMVFDASTCILCGKERGHMANIRDRCRCISMTYCKICNSDNENRSRYNWKKAVKPAYTCSVHGPYRLYNEFLKRLRNWCQLCTTIAILPLTLLLEALNISLGWVYLFMGVLIGSAVLPIVLSLCWSRLSGLGMMIGAIVGTMLGFITWLVAASQEEGGLRDFIKSTGTERSMLVGNLASILGGGLVTVIVSVVDNRNSDAAQLSSTWERTRDIDNPLRPWTEVYAKEMRLKKFNVLSNRPSLEETESRYRVDKVVAIVSGLLLTLTILIIWPVATISAGKMNPTTFAHWIRLAAAYGFIATILMVLLPIVSELYETKRFLDARNAIGDDEIDNQDCPPTNEVDPRSGSDNGILTIMLDDERKAPLGQAKLETHIQA